MQKCGNAEMRKCRNAEMQKCRNEKCRNVEMEECRNVGMQPTTFCKGHSDAMLSTTDTCPKETRRNMDSKYEGQHPCSFINTMGSVCEDTNCAGDRALSTS